MMSAERSVLLVSRHFWPHMSDATLRVLRLSAGLRQKGRTTAILTSRGDRSWPQRIRMERLPVYRVDGSPWNPLWRARHCRAMVQWMVEHPQPWELIYFDEAGLEAAYALSTTGISAPIVVRYDVAELAGGQADWKPTRQMLDICRRAHTVLVPDAASQQSLIAAGLAGSNIVRIQDWQPLVIDRSIGARREARRILGEANGELRTCATDRIVLCPGEVSDGWRLEWLVHSLAPLLEQHRSLRLWLLGDGPGRARVYAQLKHLGLHYSVTLPGVFTDLELPFQAADLCVFPSQQFGWSTLIPTCLRSDIPLLMQDSSRSRYLAGEGSTQLLFSSSGVSLPRQIGNWLKDRSLITNAVLGRKQFVLSQDPMSDVEKLLGPARIPLPEFF